MMFRVLAVFITSNFPVCFALAVAAGPSRDRPAKDVTAQVMANGEVYRQAGGDYDASLGNTEDSYARYSYDYDNDASLGNTEDSYARYSYDYDNDAGLGATDDSYWYSYDHYEGSNLGRPTTQGKQGGLGSGREFEHKSVNVDGEDRRFLLYTCSKCLPSSGGLKRPLVLLCPGSYRTAEAIFQPGSSLNDLQAEAEKRNISFAVLEGKNKLFNVGENAQPDTTGRSGNANDIKYAKLVLEEVSHSVAFCSGFSRGGRYCSMLAGKIPFKAISPFSSVRFPEPNNMSSSAPTAVYAIHGTELDTTNPFGGGGNYYWGRSVPETIKLWAEFNKCNNSVTEEREDGKILEKHTECTAGADVWLLKDKGLNHEVKSYEVPEMLDFFMAHS